LLLNNFEPTLYAMQMQNPDVLTHTKMKRQVDANKFVEPHRPEIDGLMDIKTFEFIPKINLPPRTQHINLVWTYRRKRRPDGSLKKYKARVCVNGSRRIQGIAYTKSFAPVVQWSTIRMVSTPAAMHNLKGKQIDFTQASPQEKLKEVLNYSHSRDPPRARPHGRTDKSKRPESHPTKECARASVRCLNTEPNYYYCPITFVMS
jgi:hypothetical protein